MARRVLEELRQDVRYGVRLLLRAPAFAIATVLSLAIGLGAATGVFAVINATLLSQLPYPASDRLVSLRTSLGQFFSKPAFRRLAQVPRALDLPAAAEAHEFVLTSDGMPERVSGHLITPDMAVLLGLTGDLRPHPGRMFHAADSTAEREVLISHRSWIARFDGTPDIIGSVVVLDGIPRRVVGVLRPRFDFFPDSEFLGPLGLDGPGAYDEFRRTLEVFGRLPPGTDASDMEFRLRGFFQSLRPVQRGRVELVRDRVVHGFRTALLTLWLVALLVLLVCCLNFASLLSARFWSRQVELTVRVHLGATRARLTRFLVTEGLVYAFAAGAVGIVLAWSSRAILVKTVTDGAIPSSAVTFDWRVFGASAALCAAIGIRFTLNAARRIACQADSAPGALSVSGRGTRQFLAPIVQIASTMILIGCTGVLVKSLARVQAFDVHYDTDNAVTVRVNLPFDTYPTKLQVAAFVNQMRRTTETVPGITGIAATSALPMSTSLRQLSSFMLFNDPTYPLGPPEPMPPGWPPLPPPPPPPPGVAGPSPTFHQALSFVVSPGFFETMGIPLVRGRDFGRADSSSSPRVAIVNQAFARRYFANLDPLGQRLRISPRSAWMTVVGVAGNIRRIGHDDQMRSELYRPYDQLEESAIPVDQLFGAQVNSVSFVMRTDLPPAHVSRAIRPILFGIDSNLPIWELSTLRDALDARLEHRRLIVRLLIAFSALTLVLAGIGAYGVTNYFARLRLRELSIRAALGATRRHLIWLPMRDSILVLSIGLPIGVLLSVAAASQLQFMAPDVRPFDWMTFAIGSGLLSASIVSAAFAAARQSAATDPMVFMKR